MIGSLFLPLSHYRFLLSQLVQREIKARYKQSIIGYAWVIVNPLAQLLVYSFVFSVVFRFHSTAAPYVLFLLVGLLPWTFLQGSIATATMSLVDNAPLLRKVAFPREIIPYSVVVAKLVDFAFAGLILGGFFLVLHQQVRWSMLLFFPIFLVQIFLTVGMGLLLSAFNLFYRDVQYLANLLLMLWMYLSPVVYPLDLVPPQWQSIYMINPMVGLLESYRAVLFGTPIPQIPLLIAVVFSLCIFVVGWVAFKNAEPVFADIA
jgi:lipopolysaccharide transport system permease protein